MAFNSSIQRFRISEGMVCLSVCRGGCEEEEEEKHT